MRAVLAAAGLLAVLSAGGAGAVTVIISTLGNAQGAITQTIFLDGNNLKMTGERRYAVSRRRG